MRRQIDQRGEHPAMSCAATARLSILPLAISGISGTARKYSGWSYFESPASSRCSRCPRRSGLGRAAPSRRDRPSAPVANPRPAKRRGAPRSGAASRASRSSREDVVAAADDDVLLAADDADVAIRVHPVEIAGHQPALFVGAVLGRSLLFEIAEHQAGAATADLSDFAGRERRSGLSRSNTWIS